jgi:hypothetical protein
VQAVTSDWEGWESADEVLAFVEANGGKLSRSQLVRLHKQGVISRPSVTVHQHTKKLDEVSWLLWWEHDAEQLRSARTYLVKTCTGFDKRVRWLRRAFANKRGESSDLAERVSYRLYEGNLPPPFGRIRARLGKRANEATAFEDFTVLLLGTVLGDGPVATEQQELFEAALGFDEARVTPLAGSTGWMEERHGEAISWMAKFLETPLRDVADEMTDDELISARDEAQRFLGFMVSSGEAMRRIFGGFGLGFGLAGRAAAYVLQRPSSQAFAVVLFHRLRTDPEMTEGFQVLRPTIDEWTTTGYPAWKALRVLAAEIPEIGRVLTPAHIATALRKPKGLQHLTVEVAAVRARHAAQIDVVVAAHPELFTRSGELAKSTELPNEDAPPEEH